MPLLDRVTGYVDGGDVKKTIGDAADQEGESLACGSEPKVIKRQLLAVLNRAQGDRGWG